MQHKLWGQKDPAAGQEQGWKLPTSKPGRCLKNKQFGASWLSTTNTYV